jgi:hypothetical protein
MPKTVKQTVSEQIQHLSDSALICRDLMHAWAIDRPYYRVDVEGGVRGGFYVERTKGCMRCGTQRVELYRVFRDRLELIRSHYKYPEGYLIEGAGNIQAIRGRIRREGVRRVIEEAETQEAQEEAQHATDD